MIKWWLKIGGRHEKENLIMNSNFTTVKCNNVTSFDLRKSWKSGFAFNCHLTDELGMKVIGGPLKMYSILRKVYIGA